jgi:2-polyprenyl-6-methoxyphenol hydroxylase-like FAD-dependent oxidoreductase
MASREVPVLIAGGSLVGMTTAMLLGKHGARSLVVERHPGSAIHPRAAFIMQRSMEIFRGAGIEEQVRESSYAQFESDGAIMSVETLAGKELAWHIRNLNEGVRDMSPSERLFVTQIGLEPLLFARASELGAEVLFGTELVECEQDADGVTATIRDRESGESSTVRSQYLVAADGPRSPIRERLGIGTTGRGVFSNAITIYFRADVEPLLRERNLSVVLVMNDVFAGFFRIEKPYHSGFLVVHSVGDPKDPVTNVWDLDEQECVDLVHAGLGTDAIDVAIEDVMRWEATADVADRFQDGRIFLAGDAAHVMPPYGGYGGNTGIHDAQNLAWKLAAVLDQEAPPELLATYDTERRPVARATAEQAYTRYVGRAAPYLAPGGVEPIVGDLEIDLGVRLHSRAIVGDSGDDAVYVDPRESHGAPGTRAPHLWLDRDGERVSTLDLCGAGFVLLAGPDADLWLQAAGEAGIASHRVGAPGLADPDDAFPSAYGISSAGAVLVRPDGFVAWRAADAEGASTRALAEALDTALCRNARVVGS